jgi:hypothetical protein
MVPHKLDLTKKVPPKTPNKEFGAMVQAQLSTLSMGLGDGTLNTTGHKGGFQSHPSSA